MPLKRTHLINLNPHIYRSDTKFLYLETKFPSRRFHFEKPSDINPTAPCITNHQNQKSLQFTNKILIPPSTTLKHRSKNPQKPKFSKHANYQPDATISHLKSSHHPLKPEFPNLQKIKIAHPSSKKFT